MGDVFIARQPILTKDQKIFAYELLFRSMKEQDVYAAIDGNKATAQVLENSLLTIGLSELTNHRPAFINFPTDVLLSPFVLGLPPEDIVVEILETVAPTPEIVARCRLLKERGIKLALDDFIFAPEYQELIELADYVKIDFRLTQGEERWALVKRMARPGLVFLAEKVETREEYKDAIRNGYSLLQGYFFSKPEVVAGKTLQLAEQSAMLFLQELAKEEVNYHQLETLIRHDVPLSYKILRFINSPYFGFRKEITSIRQTLTLIGQKELHKWACLLILSSLAVGKPSELMTMALVRARFAELIAGQLRHEAPSEFFLGGMFSLIDAFLDRPMVEAVAELPVKTEVKQALLGASNTLGLILQLISAYEKGDWEHGRLLAMAIGLTESWLADAYYQAELWSGRYFDVNSNL